MNNRYAKLSAIITCCSLFAAGCSEDNSTFETPAGDTDTPTNEGTVSQANFAIGSSDPFPEVYDPEKGFKETSVEITVKFGDIGNQLLTNQHTVFFKTEWGLITPSCKTEGGKCSVTWETSRFDNIPPDLFNTITAWTVGEESFTDTNGNETFDDADVTFDDLEEPYVDANHNGVFDAGDIIIDVVNEDGVHGLGDTFLNSPNCTHSSLCSTVRNTTIIWNDTILHMTDPATP